MARERLRRLRPGPLIALILSIATLAGAVLAARALPPGATAPVHIDLSGHADRVTTPMAAVRIWTCLLGGFWLLMAWLSFCATRAMPAMTPRTLEAFDQVWIAMTAGLALLVWGCFAQAAGQRVDNGGLLAVMFGLLLTTLGNTMGKLDPNPIIGIRTAATLRDPEIWDRTHRIGSRIMTATGLVLLLAGIGLVGRVSVASAVGVVVMVSIVCALLPMISAPGDRRR